jgi:hypothetical protein
MDPSRSGDAYIPSDDGMSDILHNAGNAYTMYLDPEFSEDPHKVSPSDVSPV